MLMRASALFTPFIRLPYFAIIICRLFSRLRLRHAAAAAYACFDECLLPMIRFAAAAFRYAFAYFMPLIRFFQRRHFRQRAAKYFRH